MEQRGKDEPRIHSAQRAKCYASASASMPWSRKMQEFFDALSSSYATNKQLLSLEEIEKSSGEDKIIGLLASGIGPDGIASLFLLIARAFLLSGKVIFPNLKTWELSFLVRNSLLGALHKRLEEAAQGFDRSVQERLETMRHIAQIYRTITEICIFGNFLEKNKQADQLCQKTREGIEDYFQLKLHPMPELRLAATKDSLRVISDHVAAIKVPAVGQQSNS